MRLVYNILFGVTLVGGSAAAWLLPTTTTTRPVVDASPSSVRRAAIAFYEHRLGEDPHSALDMAQLAALVMEEGRMSGDERAFVKAESIAIRSLGERTRKNGRSAALLVNALLAQHRFAEANAVAHDLAQREPDEPAYRALLAESMMEVGDYAGAIRELGTIRARRADLGIAPRFARWAELTGQTGEARRILRQAREDATHRPDLTGEQRAWFGLRLADLELRYGNLRGAKSVIREALREAPDDWRLVLARARLDAARGAWARAARSAEEVIAAVPSPDAFALLAVAQRELGNDEEAEAFELALAGIVAGQSGMVHRTWAMTLLDRGLSVREIIAAAATDTIVRQDMHSLDFLAWALHRAGRSAEALPLMRRAIGLGSVEPALRYHAGAIEFAAGDRTLARQHFTIALGRRRALSREQVAEMQHALATIARSTRN